jgi:hypothetical protein
LLSALLLICKQQHCNNNNNNNNYYYYYYYKYNNKPYTTTMSTEEADDDAHTAFSFGKMAFALQQASNFPTGIRKTTLVELGSLSRNFPMGPV